MSITQYTPGFVGPLTLIYGVTGQAASLTVKVTNATADTVYYGPSGTGIEEDEGGVYDLDSFTFPSVAGTYRVYWYLSGTLIPESVSEFRITYTPYVVAAPSSGDLCSIDDVYTVMETSAGDAELDARLPGAITAVSQELMRRLGRELVPQSTGLTRRFSLRLDSLVQPSGQIIVDLDPFEIRNVTGVVINPVVSPVTLGSTDWVAQPLPSRDGSYLWLELSPYLAYASTDAYRFTRVSVDVTGDWGLWSSPPQWAREQVALAVRARIRQSMARDVYSQNAPDGQVITAPPPVYGLPQATVQAFAHLERTMA